MATKKTVEEKGEEKGGRVYEVGYHILPAIEGEAVEKVVEGIRELVTKQGGSLIAEGAPAETKLAYTMYVNNEGKNTPYTHAHFGWIKFELGSGDVQAVEDALSINRSLLRYLLFKTVREETRSSVRAGMLREVKSRETLKTTVRKEEGGTEVSEEKLDQAIEGLVA